MIKNIYKNLQLILDNILVSLFLMVKDGMLPPETGSRVRMSTLPLRFHVVLEGQTHVIRQGKDVSR